jgi:hypothetical protein
MNWKQYGRKQSWSNLRYYPGISLEGMRKALKNLSLIFGLRFESGTLGI